MTRKAQNTSAAVMAKREAKRDDPDLFPTPPWATRALCAFLSARQDIGTMVAYDPAAGLGHMTEVLREFFADVRGSDIFDYGKGWKIVDYTSNAEGFDADWIITNPPFARLTDFVTRALTEARRGVAMLVRTAALEGGDRFRRIYDCQPPTHVLQFSERVAMVRGRYDPEATTATAYCWMVWDLTLPRRGTILAWFPPGVRRRFETASDARLAATSEP
jgi:hypothetical protein